MNKEPFCEQLFKNIEKKTVRKHLSTKTKGMAPLLSNTQSHPAAIQSPRRSENQLYLLMSEMSERKLL